MAKIDTQSCGILCVTYVVSAKQTAPRASSLVLANGLILSDNQYYVGGTSPQDMYVTNGGLMKQAFVYSFQSSDS
jgi:hypothetical protein